MQFPKRTALALVTTLFAAGAQSALVASASIGQIDFELIDLNPDDGVAPSITWTGLSSVNINDGAAPGFLVLSGASDTELGEAPASYSRTRAGFGGLAVQVDGEPSFSSLLAAYLSEDGITNFVLSAQTQLNVRAVTSLVGSLDEGCFDVDDPLSCAFVSASASLSLEGPAANGDAGSDLQFTQSLRELQIVDSGADSLIDEELFVSFVNGTNSSMDGQFNAVVQLDVGIPEPESEEVPEPMTAALLLTLTPWLTQGRRKSRSAHP